MPADPYGAAFWEVTEPLRGAVNDWEVTDAEAALAGRRLLALDDAAFDAVSYRMATIDEGRYLRRLITETEEMRDRVPEAVRLFVARLATRAAPATARAAFEALRGHALGRFLDALGRIGAFDARKLVMAAGGPEVVAATAIEEALRARADDDPRSTASLARGISALLRVAPPQTKTFREFALHFAGCPRAWPGIAVSGLLSALERGAVQDLEAMGYLPDPRFLPEAFDGEFLAALFADLALHRARAARPPSPE